MADDEEKTLSLRVAKAIPSDVGHGRARVPFDNDLGLKPGDVIEISGERNTAAIVWRCRPEDANLGVIRIDGIIRKNAGVSLGDRVSIKKVETKECERLVQVQSWPSNRRSSLAPESKDSPVVASTSVLWLQVTAFSSQA